jgi:hypothetical protein
MPTVSAQRLLQQEIRALPDDLTIEVLDFVQFLKARRAEDGFLWQQVEETRAYREQHPDEVWTVSADEFLAATRRYPRSIVPGWWR